jgi:hypothetical protein
LDCGGTLNVPAGSSATCGYSANLPDASSRVNTATAKLNSVGFTGTANVEFNLNSPNDVIDECIYVTDTYAGFLGIACGRNAPMTFSYSRDIGPYAECGQYQVPNTASFVTNDTGTTGNDGWTVIVDVPCAGGCSLTPGYWKTHSAYGPAPYDETWAQIGEDTLFFLSGQSYYDVLWTSPRGNAYYILAHAYIAAELNFLNGADPSATQAAFDEATALFSTYTPEDVANAKGKNGKELRDQFIAAATILDNYNNGYIGPGHCDE